MTDGSAFYNEIDDFAVRWLRALVTKGHIAPGNVERVGIEHLTADRIGNATQAHFFAGIGVWSYALRLAGWPDDRPAWTGSCPCQPFSNAGGRRGASDARHLWPAWFSLIRECRPPVIFGEQVASRSGRHWLDAVSADLETLGYAVGAADLCAAGVGAPHIRQRLFWVAYADGSKRERGTDEPIGKPERGTALGRDRKDGPANPTQDPWHTDSTIRSADGVWRPWVSSLADGHSQSLANGSPEVLGRLRGYGNAIVAPLAAAFIRSVMGIERLAT